MIQSRFEIAREEGERHLVLKLFQNRFGPIPQKAQQFITECPLDRLPKLAEQIALAPSYDESLVDAWRHQIPAE